MKKLIPRNTTIPVRRSDVFSTSENNQTMVEVHVVQGEREMASDNKSLGRFKLMGIPPAPRGIPQVQVSFDIDANGILQVTAMDKTTGREQGITIQGASNLNEAEINRMVQEAELYADQDRQKRDRIEKRTKAEALTYEAERQLREVALDFGMQFASSYRRRIENLVQELRDHLKKDDDRGIDIAQADLRDALYDLQREVYQLTQEDEGETDFFGSIRRTLSSIGEDLFGDDEEYYDDRRDPYSREPYSRDSYSRDSSYGRDYRDSSRDSYSRDSWDTYERGSRDAYPGEDYSRGESTRDNYPSSSARSRDTYSRTDRDVSDRGERDAYSRDSRDSRDNRDNRDSWDRDSSPESREPYDRRDRDTYAREDRDVYDDQDRDAYSRGDQNTSDRSSRNPYDRGVSRSPSREPSRDQRDPYGQDPYVRENRDLPSRNPAGRERRSPDTSRSSYEANANRYNSSNDDWDDDDEWL
ncbi:MAG TPA: Hsp70 family protein, partial [Coleofasciculaceae cyanobacterium]